MAIFRKGKSRGRELIGRAAMFGTIVVGFLSVIFSKESDAGAHLFHDHNDSGVAHADAPACSGSSSSGDSNSGSSSDSTGDSGGGGGGG